MSSNPNIFGIHCFGMVAPFKLDVQSRNTVMEFLRTELSVALIFASIAERQRKSGCHEAVKTSMADAERVYLSLLEFLSKPRCAKLIKVQEQAEFEAALKRLRKKLDSLTA